MIIALAADHAGRPLLERVAEAVRATGQEAVLVHHDGEGPADDYPDVALAAANVVVAGRADRAILLCGSGAGVSVAANKVRGVRAALAHDSYTGHQMVEHDDCNVLCIGARVVGPELAAEVAAAFVGATFSGEDRHRRRLGKVLQLDAQR